MPAVNKIEITGVAVTKASNPNCFDITLSWDLDEGALDYSGNFWLIPHHGNQHDSLLKINCGGQIVREATVQNVPLAAAKEYSLALTASETRFTSCDKIPITTRTFEDVGVHYENDIVTIGWNPPHPTIRSGLIRLEFPFGDFYDYGVPEGLYVYTFAIPEAWMDSYSYRMPLPGAWFSQVTCTVSMTPYACECSSGLESEKVTLALQPLEIKSVSLGAMSGNSRDLTVEFSSSAAQCVQLGLYRDGKLASLTEPIPFANTIKHAFNGQFAHRLEEFELAAYISNSNATSYNRRKTFDNAISLETPKLSTDIASGKLVLSWTHDAPDCTSYHLQLGTAAAKEVYGSSHTFTEPVAGLLDSEISLTPGYGARSGVAAKTTAFREGIYATGSCLAYRGKSYSGQGFSFALPSSVFAEPVTSVVEEGSFKLEQNGNGYKVTVSGDDPERAGYTAWLALLFGKKLNPSGYYKIRDVLSRLLAFSESERLWYMAGIGENASKRADILPGMILRVESAVYMPQTSPTAANLAGYTPGSAVDYTVGLSDGFLSVSPYLDKTMGHFVYSGEPYSDPLFHAAGGGLDFFNIDLKQPYWVLCYPGKFPRSESLSSLYPTGNATLYALPEWAGTQTLDNETQHHIVFRARSTVSLLHTVFVNSAPQLVPVGATVDDLMTSLGCAGQTCRLYRNTGLGKMAEVFWFDCAATYLMRGDRVEV